MSLAPRIVNIRFNNKKTRYRRSEGKSPPQQFVTQKKEKEMKTEGTDSSLPKESQTGKV